MCYRRLGLKFWAASLRPWHSRPRKRVLVNGPSCLRGQLVQGSGNLSCHGHQSTNPSRQLPRWIPNPKNRNKVRHRRRICRRCDILRFFIGYVTLPDLRGQQGQKARLRNVGEAETGYKKR